MNLQEGWHTLAVRMPEPFIGAEGLRGELEMAKYEKATRVHIDAVAMGSESPNLILVVSPYG